MDARALRQRCLELAIATPNIDPRYVLRAAGAYERFINDGAERPDAAPGDGVIPAGATAA